MESASAFQVLLGWKKSAHATLGFWKMLQLQEKQFAHSNVATTPSVILLRENVSQNKPHCSRRALMAVAKYTDAILLWSIETMLCRKVIFRNGILLKSLHFRMKCTEPEVMLLRNFSR